MSGYLQDKQDSERRKPVTLPGLIKMRDAGEKITMLTTYDASFASLMDRCGVDMLLVGDSLGNVIQGRDTTLPVVSRSTNGLSKCSQAHAGWRAYD